MPKNQAIDFNGISVAIKKGGSGANAIVFIHGNSMDSDTWLPQFEDKELNSRYQLIAFDLPGHGRSGWYKDDATCGYRPKNILPLLNEILDTYAVKRFLLVGLSYGTNIIGEIQSPLPGCVGIMLASPCIVNNVFSPSEILTPGPNGHVIVAANPSDKELHDYTFLHQNKKEIGERFIKTYRAADPTFRKELGKAMFENDLTDELENIANWKLPVCVVFGKDETLIKTNYLDGYEPLWHNQVHFVENAGHLINEEEPAAFNKLLLAYAEEAFR